MSRIEATLGQLAAGGRTALIPFFTAGDPEPGLTVPIMQALVRGGADIIEVGVPFSDPMADGPTIQRSSERALKHGTSLRQILGLIAEFRAADKTTPVVLMGYANPIEAMGLEAFAEQCREVGVDGVLVVDYPPEECAPLAQLLAARGIDAIFLLSPTTVDERIDEVARLARGYIYYVSLKGVTGAGNLDLSELRQRIPRIRARVGVPVGVGFGIRDAATASAISEFADAVVIGSRLVEEIERAERTILLDRVSGFMREMRTALDA
ncbi:MAG TPA: tryptophan synthase subunit alpha [Burkholderiales bacterium]|nr:tryptophan synthase subunit alpha [Betaproteobacteria bacterium]HQR52500.1 tryptophan synthase subunit alpha [Burkholderiales bacterium]